MKRVFRLLVCCLAVQFVSSRTLAQGLNKQDFCPVIQDYTPPDTEFCLANRSPFPSDRSYVLAAQHSGQVDIFLIRFDLPKSGSCAPSNGASRSYLCSQLNWDVPPDFDAICNFDRQYWPCSDGRQGGRFLNEANPGVSGPGGVNQGPSERFFVAARGLEAGDVSVQELAGSLIYGGSLGSVTQSLRIHRNGERTQALDVRLAAAEDSMLQQSISRIIAEAVPLDSVTALGVGGRFMATVGSEEIFFGTSTDCDGRCEARPVLRLSAFQTNLHRLRNIVAIEQDTLTTDEVRSLLRERILMGELAIPDLDEKLEDARIRQPPAFLLLDWN